MKERHGVMQLEVTDDDKLLLHFDASTSLCTVTALSWHTLHPLILHEIKCVPACMRVTVRVCVCLQSARPASCQCVALNPAKAKPNYRRMATDLAGMLTITEEAAGRGSLGKVTAGREVHKSGPQGQGRGGTLFQDLLLSLFIIVEGSATRSTLQLTAHIDAKGQTLSKPPNPLRACCHL